MPLQRSTISSFIISTLFFLCGVFVVLPFFDIPFIGLSVTAPLILPVMYYALFQPPRLGFIGIAAGSHRRGHLAGDGRFVCCERSLVRGARRCRRSRSPTSSGICSGLRYSSSLPTSLRISGSSGGCRSCWEQRSSYWPALRCFEGIVLGKIGAWTRHDFHHPEQLRHFVLHLHAFSVSRVSRSWFHSASCSAPSACSPSCLPAPLTVPGDPGSASRWRWLFSFCWPCCRDHKCLCGSILPVGFAALALASHLAGSTRAAKQSSAASPPLRIWSGTSPTWFGRS